MVYPLAQAYVESWWTPLAIYGEETPVGHVMYGRLPGTVIAWIQRIIIDARCQDEGYGRTAVNACSSSRAARRQPRHEYAIRWVICHTLRLNRWFEGRPHRCLVAERTRFRAIVEAGGKVAAVFNGHLHWNHLDAIASVPYVTLQRLTENLDDDAPGRPAKA